MRLNHGALELIEWGPHQECFVSLTGPKYWRLWLRPRVMSGFLRIGPLEVSWSQDPMAVAWLFTRRR